MGDLAGKRTVRARYWAKVYRTGSTAGCWYFFGGISSTGHASFRAASRPGKTRRGTVPGHLYGHQLAHAVIPRLGWGADSPTVCHTCDNHSCRRPTHLRLGTAAENRAEWLARRACNDDLTVPSSSTIMTSGIESGILRSVPDGLKFLVLHGSYLKPSSNPFLFSRRWARFVGLTGQVHPVRPKRGE